VESREGIREVIATAVSASEDGGYDRPVENGVLRSLFTAMQSGSAPWMRFLGGGITFCSMKPMRPLPFRVVAILGMADGEFPRNVKPLSFDLMQMCPGMGTGRHGWMTATCFWSFCFQLATA
jgi:exodeoxyribonuclease V gamma subunit